MILHQALKDKYLNSRHFLHQILLRVPPRHIPIQHWELQPGAATPGGATPGRVIPGAAAGPPTSFKSLFSLRVRPPLDSQLNNLASLTYLAWLIRHDSGNLLAGVTSAMV